MVAPFDCLACGREGDIICAGCLAKATTAKASACVLCNKATQRFRTCPHCRRISHLSGAIVAATLAHLLVPVTSPAHFDLVTAIPSASLRLRQRGYNPAHLIGLALAKSLQLPYRPMLGKHGQHRQVGTSRQQRLKQLRGTIYLRPRSAVTGRRVLVVDDVVTTGATMVEAARALHQAGAANVWGAAVAKH